MREEIRQLAEKILLMHKFAPGVRDMRNLFKLSLILHFFLLKKSWISSGIPTIPRLLINKVTTSAHNIDRQFFTTIKSKKKLPKNQKRNLKKKKSTWIPL